MNKFKYPIDLVYLWVDGKDKEWQKQKCEWLQKLNLPHSQDNDSCRFVDNQELKYSLRSVSENMPWINKIFIVTNGQVPEWLNINNPKIKIINHKDIMPESALPTFNSCAIEACVSNIPGLSEHFLLANDDCFINKKITPEFFFDREGKPICRFIKYHYTESKLENSLYLRSIKNSIQLINNKYKKHFKNIVPHHNIDAYTKNEYKKCYDIFKCEFDKVINSKFRIDNIQRIIVALYMITQGKATKKIVRTKNFFHSFVHSYCININSYEFMQHQLLKLRPVLMCINDEPDVLSLFKKELRLFLEGVFPNPSEFEKSTDDSIKKLALEKYNRVLKINNEKIKKEKFKDFYQSIFSIKNTQNNEKLSKRFNILGISFSIKIYDKDTVLKNYKRVLKSLKEKYKKYKIKVIFIVRENQKWTYQSLYNLFESSEKFEPLVLVAPLTSVHIGKDTTRDTLQENYLFFKSRNMNVDYLYKNNKYLKLDKFKPDLIFYDQPWEIHPKHKPAMVSKFALTFYSSYSYEILNDTDNYFRGFHPLLFKYFVEHESNIERYTAYNKYASKNCVVTGYPKLDEYLRNEEVDPSKYFKNPDCYKIIYAPHHSFDNSLQLATFMENGKFILDFAKKHPETTWCFKPHPRLKFALLKMNYMSEDEINKYYNDWEKIGNVYTKGDYIKLFKASDLMLTDCLSFLAEYLPSKKPLIRMINPNSKELNSLGKMITQEYYNSHSNEELQKLLETVALKGEDIKKNNRIILSHNIIDNNESSALKIFNYINSLLKGDHNVL